MKRASINLKTKLAAALLQMRRYDDNEAAFVPVIAYERAKSMTADQIIAHFHFDHWPILHTNGGPDEPWNLVPRPVAEHREKTAKQDAPAIAKGRRLRRRVTEHQLAVRAKLLVGSQEKFNKRAAKKMQSRGFPKKRPMFDAMAKGFRANKRRALAAAATPKALYRMIKR